MARKTKTSVGSIGILANHAPLLAMLDPTELRLYESDTEIVRFAQGEGYLQVSDNKALMLVEDAIRPDALDVENLRERLDEAARTLEQAQDGSAEQAKARRDKRRWEAFLKVAEGPASS
ncbi:MAG: F0F1 ATP synthase subunit epsilon [Solirubrobacterales bacterium]|nr:F0F1 ATP synthase subunit epsilon [Solirubrobacterales bacterium]